MRSILYQNLLSFAPHTKFKIEGDQFHHLINVCRLKLDDEILILDGKGHYSSGSIEFIDKKHLILSFGQIKKSKENVLSNIIVGISYPKKKYHEDLLRSLSELGVKKIIFFKSEFSPKININIERLKKIIIQGVELSNNKYLPMLEIFDSFDDLIEQYRGIQNKIVFTLKANPAKLSDLECDFQKESFLLYGPEGGFSALEVEKLEKQNFNAQHLELPILRLVTAVPCSLGIIFAKIKSIK